MQCAYIKVFPPKWKGGGRLYPPEVQRKLLVVSLFDNLISFLFPIAF